MRDPLTISSLCASLLLAVGACSTTIEPRSDSGVGGSGGATAGRGGVAGGGSGGGSTGGAGAGSGGAGGSGLVAGGGGSGGGVFTGGAGGNDVGVLEARVTTWRDDATAAYTIIHDDLCDPTLDSLFDAADPELTARGLRAGFGAIVGSCSERGLWSKLQTLRDHGHEIVCHSWSHPNMVDGGPDLMLELSQATSTLDANLVGQKTSYFIFPFDAFNDGLLAELETLGYLGARAGARGLNPTDFSDPMRSQFDVWGATVYAEGPLGLQEYVDDAILNAGWANREFHAVGSEAWEPVGTEDYKAHLDYVKAKVDAGELWVDTPSEVVRYRFARENCGEPAVTAGTLGFTAAGPVCAKYATPLSVEITTTVDATTLYAKQNGQTLATTKLGPKLYRVDVDPTQGTTYIGGI